MGVASKAASSNFIGKIETLVTNNRGQYGFIRSNSTFENHSGDVSFNESDLIDNSFSELSQGNIVGFSVETIINGGKSLLVARQVKSKISGTIKNLSISNPERQFFWGMVKPDSDSFLASNQHIIILNQHLQQDNIMNQLHENMKVDFTVEENIGGTKPYRVKSIIFPAQTYLPEPITTSSLKESFTNLLQGIETIKHHAEFEDLVFLLFRMIGIHKLYQYSRHNAAGRADGIFILGNLAVIYDCTLMSDCNEFKADQLKNYISQISKESFTINKKNRHTGVVEHIIQIPQHRQVWIVTNETITQRKSRTLKNVNSIWIKEVSIQTLIKLFLKRLNSPTFEEETLAEHLRLIERV